MDKIYQFISGLLNLSYYEARGFVGLLIVSVIALILMFFPEIVIRKKSTVDPANVKQLDSLVAILSAEELSEVKQTLFTFDPNFIAEDSLILLGFPKSVATRLINYRSKGGRFIIKQDVKKIYGVSDQLIEAIYSFIDLPETLSKSSENIPNQRFDINKARVDQLKKVSMIGDMFAARIVNYRNSLGGFVSKNQFEEVYGISDLALKNLNSIVYISSGFQPRRVKINLDSFEVLRSHPYISDPLAEDILRFRKINDTIGSEKVLINFKSIDKSKFEKLILYLDFRN